MTDDNILRKIKKCLALSASSNPGEASNALRQAQKLMELHGISQLDVRRADLGEASVKSKFSVSRIKDYELDLLNTVARAFGCRLLWKKSRSWAAGDEIYGTYTLLGLKSQVELAQYTCDVMQRKLVKARAEFVTTLPGHLCRAAKVREADGFCKGWVSAVRKTVIDFALGDETKQLLDEVVTERSSGKTAAVQNRAAGAYGTAAGRAAGAGESIFRPMNQAAPTLQLETA